MTPNSSFQFITVGKAKVAADHTISSLEQRELVQHTCSPLLRVWVFSLVDALIHTEGWVLLNCLHQDKPSQIFPRANMI